MKLPLGDNHLKMLWRLREAETLRSYTLRRGGKHKSLVLWPFVFIALIEDTLEIQADHTYVFAHPGIKPDASATLDQLWKGLVTEIKRIPSRKDVIVNVIWFWSRNDVERAVKDQLEDPALTQILENMANNELCAGSLGVLNSSDCISSDVNIVYLETDESKLSTQDPVVDYFFRMVWDETELVMKMDPLGCDKQSCHMAWNPDTHEQRYCDPCKKWYHVSCLRAERSENQNSIIKQAISNYSLPSLPASLLDVAFQPIARGGLRHFTAGNIRIVMKARDLSKNATERAAVTKGMKWENVDWMAYLNDLFGLHDGSDENEECALVTGQKVYRCGCKTLI